MTLHVLVVPEVLPEVRVLHEVGGRPAHLEEPPDQGGWHVPRLVEELLGVQASVDQRPRDRPHVPEVDRGRHRHEVVDGKLRLRREGRSEEHTSELQSLTNLVCRLLLEKKKKKKIKNLLKKKKKNKIKKKRKKNK